MVRRVLLQGIVNAIVMVPTRKFICSPISDLNVARAAGSWCPSADLDVGAHVLVACLKKEATMGAVSDGGDLH
jgi:hypothetical protein